MKVVVIGGTGLIGSHIVEKLNAHGHDVKPAALQTGTNTITGESVDDAVTGAEVLIDVSSSPSFADDDSLVPGPDAWLASTTYDDCATASGS